jgi:hypothetical protein
VNYSAVKELLKESIAISTSFQTWIEATGDAAAKLAAAKARIHTTSLNFDTATRPNVLIRIGNSSSAEKIAGGTHDFFDRHGSLLVFFTADRAGDTADITALEAFASTVADVMDDVLDVSGTGGYLAIENVEIEDPFAINSPDELDSDQAEDIYCICSYQVFY